MKFLKGFDVSGLRDLLRLPPNREITSRGLTVTEVDAIDIALQYILDGMIRLVEIRVADGRALVVAFNKAKHMLLAFPEGDYLRLVRIESENKLGGKRIPITIEYAIGRARQALETQDVLHTTLGLIFSANGWREPTADWVLNARETWPERIVGNIEDS